ncbi:MAG TPA: hypothetical protein VMB18_19600 [Terriglobales bacterium]|nr:hypothetical protein [Terriglobales bacterium]
MTRTLATSCRLFTALCLLLGLIPTFAATQKNPIVIHEIKHDVSLPLSVMAKLAPPAPSTHIIMREHRSPKHFFNIVKEQDPVVQTEYGPLVSTQNLLSFDGVTENQGGAQPPDTNGSVGATQFVLITNFDYQVFDKSGNQILAPTRIHTIWSGFGGECSSDDGGDPIVLWDKLAQRWLVEQLEYFGTDLVCVAVSTTEDATGSYNRYSFSFGSALPDYPKLSVWPDAYYLSVNNFGAGYGEPCALDRTAMLAGTTATMQCFSPNSQNFSFLPSDVDGATLPPSGAPAKFVELGNTNTTLNEYDFHVDFTNPNNSTFTGPHTITVPAYTLLCGGGGGACIPQPGTSVLVDALGDRPMYRLAYRNYGDHEAMVLAHSISPGSGSTAVAATRWYELRATPPGGSWTLYQTGTESSKTYNIWMASVAMDKVGNMAIGASFDNKTNVDPSIGYSGRVPSDPLGKLEGPKIIVKGTGVETSSNRWGDYSSMSVDPSDDCTFWYTQMYYKTTGIDWVAHVASFKFTSCN